MNSRRMFLGALMVALASLTLARAEADTDVPAKASVGDKYSKLLRKIAVPEDKATYGEFDDWGYWNGTEWAGYSDLPPGYWVYVEPHWYIWEKMAEKKKKLYPVQFNFL